MMLFSTAKLTTVVTAWLPTGSLKRPMRKLDTISKAIKSILTHLNGAIILAIVKIDSFYRIQVGWNIRSGIWKV